MFKILTLVCLGTDPSACTLQNAVDVIRGPERVGLQQCMFLGQAQLAATALVPDPGKQVARVICRPAKLAER